MKEIKTKGSKKDIRVLDKTVGLSAKMKRGLSRTKEQAQNLNDNNHTSPDEYAQDNIKYASEDLARNAVHGSKETVKKAMTAANASFSRSSKKGVTATVSNRRQSPPASKPSRRWSEISRPQDSRRRET